MGSKLPWSKTLHLLWWTHVAMHCCPVGCCLDPSWPNVLIWGSKWCLAGVSVIGGRQLWSGTAAVYCTGVCRAVWDVGLGDESARLLGWLCSWGGSAVSEHLAFLTAHACSWSRFVPTLLLVLCAVCTSESSCLAPHPWLFNHPISCVGTLDIFQSTLYGTAGEACMTLRVAAKTSASVSWAPHDPPHICDMQAKPAQGEENRYPLWFERWKSRWGWLEQEQSWMVCPGLLVYLLPLSWLEAAPTVTWSFWLHHKSWPVLYRLVLLPPLFSVELSPLWAFPRRCLSFRPISSLIPF